LARACCLVNCVELRSVGVMLSMNVFLMTLVKPSPSMGLSVGCTSVKCSVPMSLTTTSHCGSLARCVSMKVAFVF